MEEYVELTNHYDYTASKLLYKSVDTCPICKAKIKPVFIKASLNSTESATVFDYCVSCHQSFITQYHIIWSPNKGDNGYRNLRTDKILLSVPNKYKPRIFTKEIESLSPSFVKTYNQSLNAELENLDEIAGMGYRKSIEYLVKDYSISSFPDDAETIKKIWLGKCIDDYIDNDKIKILAKKSTWLGNDEAHYIKKYDDRDIRDIKQFIDAIVYYISMEFIVKDAESIERK